MKKAIQLLVLSIISVNCYALSIESIFQNDVYLINKVVMDQSFLKKMDRYSGIHFEVSERYLQDPFKRVSKEFKIPKYFYESVFFWFNIYTVFPSNSVVLHDKKNLSIIYKVIDYVDLLKSDIGKFTAATMQSYLTTKHVRLLKLTLHRLIKKTQNFTAIEKSVIDAIKKRNPNIIPVVISKRRKFFNKLMRNLRSQTGQKDAIVQGVKNYIPFEPAITGYFKAFDAPVELFSIAFLESSFNPRAVSKAGATGAWQFLRRSGKAFMKINSYVDHRLNPLLATFGAIYLLKENRQILRRWDLAITAYNAGPGHFIKGRRKLKMRAPSLELLLEKYEHPNIGFAVKNYYSEFLALVYTLAYKNEIYKKEIVDDSEKLTLNISQDHISIYTARRRFKPRSLYIRHKKISPDLQHLNRHIKKYRTLYPKGTIIFSDVELDSKKFRKLKLNKLLKRYPKNWAKLAY